MERIADNNYSEVIGEAFRLLPPALEVELRYVHFLTGVDPIYAGLHDSIAIGDGRSFRNTAHVVFGRYEVGKQERTTIVLPLLADGCLVTIIHELGHCLDELLRFEHMAVPVNIYAETNRMEAFAEAFTAEYFWLGDEEEDIFQSDKSTRVLFEQLARGQICLTQ